MVDINALDDITRELRTGHHDLEGLSVPGLPDAGALTGALAGVLAHVVAGAGQFSTGLALAGSTVHQSRLDYVAADVLRSLW
jgi:hypothetical protein